MSKKVRFQDVPEASGTLSILTPNVNALILDYLSPRDRLRDELVSRHWQYLMFEKVHWGDSGARSRDEFIARCKKLDLLLRKVVLGGFIRLVEAEKIQGSAKRKYEIDASLNILLTEKYGSRRQILELAIFEKDLDLFEYIISKIPRDELLDLFYKEDDEALPLFNLAVSSGCWAIVKKLKGYSINPRFYAYGQKLTTSAESLPETEDKAKIQKLLARVKEQTNLLLAVFKPNHIEQMYDISARMIGDWLFEDIEEDEDEVTVQELVNQMLYHLLGQIQCGRFDQRGNQQAKLASFANILAEINNDNVVIDITDTLINALRENKIGVNLELILQCRPDVDRTDEMDNTSLHNAISWGKVENVRAILRSAPNTNAINCQGETPLDKAIRKSKQEPSNADRAEILRLVREYHEANAEKFTLGEIDFNELAMKEEISKSKFESLKQYFSQDGVNEIANASEICKFKLLTWLKSEDSVEPLEELPHVLLTSAITEGNEEAFDLILDKCSIDVKKMVNTCESPDSTIQPLFFAMSKGNETLVRRLLKLGADINDHKGSVRFVMSQWGVSLHYTPLHFAITRNNLPMVQLLLEYNPDLSITSIKDETPLGYATRKEKPEMIAAIKESLARAEQAGVESEIESSSSQDDGVVESEQEGLVESESISAEQDSLNSEGVSEDKERTNIKNDVGRDSWFAVLPEMDDEPVSLTWTARGRSPVIVRDLNQYDILFLDINIKLKIDETDFKEPLKNIIAYTCKLMSEDNRDGKTQCKIDAATAFLRTVLESEEINPDEIHTAAHEALQNDENRGTGFYKVHSFFKNKRYWDEDPHKGLGHLVKSTLGELIYDFDRAVARDSNPDTGTDKNVRI